MLAKLSLKNIKKSFKDYAIYFFTLILGVAIFYVFNAIESQTVLLEVTSSTQELIKLMENMLSGVSVFVSFILGFLIIYASQFLIKRRNKEFGIYMTLGMSKKKISTILFFETLFIGILSLVLGLAIGVVLSQFMSLLVANMFEADMTNFSFIFSKSAALKTLLYFGIMYLLVMVFNTVSISKCKLIDLLHGQKVSEEVKLKSMSLSCFVFIIGVILLSRAYYMVTAGFAELQNAESILIPIALGSVSTFLIFWSLSGLILRIVTSIKKLYYKGLNSFTLRQFSSKINTMVFSMTIICLMLFVTICVLASSLSIKNSLAKNIDELSPADIELTKKVNHTSMDSPEYSIEEINTRNLDISDTLAKVDISIDDYLKEYVTFDTYELSDLTLKKSFGSKLDDIMKNYKFLNYEGRETIIKLSDYNLLAKIYGKEQYSLEEDEYIIIADFESFVNIRNNVLEKKEPILLAGRTLHPKYTECQNGFIDLSSGHINSGVFIVPDSVLDSQTPSTNYMIGNYKNEVSRDEKKKFEENLVSLRRDRLKEGILVPSINSRLDIAEASIGLGALVTFIGLYLGIIFLMASAAILALKELSESADNKERFDMIRELGADERTINRALFNQIAIFFMTPLVFALIHSIFGMKFSMIILESIGTKGLTASIAMTVTFLLVIYGGYFLVTYYCSKSIIKNHH